MLPLIFPIQNAASFEALFDAWADRPHTARLQGGWQAAGLGRYSVLAIDPYEVLVAVGDRLSLSTPHEDRSWRGDPFAALSAQYQRLKSYPVGDDAAEAGLPFWGGGIGYLGYGLRRFVERVPARVPLDLPTPDLYIAFYDVALIYDHRQEQGYVVSSGLPAAGSAALERAKARLQEVVAWMREAARRPVRAPRAEEVLAGAEAAGREALSERYSAMDRRAYIDAVRRAKAYIAAGDVYQVNLAQRFSVPAPVRPATLFHVLRHVNPSPFGAYLNGPGWTILSVSPERFFCYDGTCVETRPIKGTRPRAKEEGADLALRDELLASGKDRAEHVMIVDLERNDLGRFCEYHTVRVPELMVCEAHPTVWHLVSTVRGVPRPGVSVIEGVRAMFPGGSITGAPKVRAMEIIDELEPVARGVYTGSIGYFSAGGRIDLNIAIRTVVHARDEAHFHVGGGIVADSDPEAEYQETLDKGLGIARALEIARQVQQ